ncbi:scavenger receptor cysteine-rich type 1 protein M130-like [Dendrobates tinctorius]|uniref:scavenger receptor cysteine-rich type 1 protein M130-like n=1 Tax=Dendrobates tinctorius TaxID=92724 RepID=UPI003CCA6DBC
MCRELQCGEAVPSLVTYTRRPGPIWTEKIHCVGDESRLLDCTKIPEMKNCTKENPPAIQCKVEVRLSGGTNCSGRVEVKYKGEWGGVFFSEHWIHLSTVIHRQLGCIIPNADFLTNASEFGNIKSILLFAAINCSGEESYLSQCKFYPFKINDLSTDIMAGLTYPGYRDYRLVDGPNDCSGYLQAKQGNTWGSVCAIDEDLRTANVICRELQCGEAVPSLVTYTRRPGPIWMDQIRCIGNESRLLNCTIALATMKNCTKENHPYIQCKVEVRLSGGTTNCTGRVEVKYKGAWGGVLYDADVTNLSTVVQRQMGCIMAKEDLLIKASEFGNIKMKLWFHIINCSGEESYLSQCWFYEIGVNDFATDSMAGLTYPGSKAYRLAHGPSECSGQLEVRHGGTWESVCEIDSDLKAANVFCMMGSKAYRLAHGPSECSGQLEVRHGGTWESVCEIDSDLKAANVMCRELSCGQAMTPSLNYTRRSGTIWTNQIQCIGNETRLLDCLVVPGLDGNCTKQNPPVIQCEELRLTGGLTNCMGIVEMYYKGEWGAVRGVLNTDSFGTVVCRQLGCTSPNGNNSVINADTFGEEFRLVLFKDVNCEGEELLLSQCKHETGRHLFTSDALSGVICSAYRDYRLVDGSDECSGHLEAQIGDSWGSLCDLDSALRVANVLCKELQCGEAVPSLVIYTRRPGPIWTEKIHCVGNESRLLDCPKHPGVTKHCTKPHPPAIQCKGR